MKLIDAINKIDKSHSNKNWVDIEALAWNLDIQLNRYVETQDRVKCYWLGNWYCTDSYVGYAIYFFDDEPVALSVQQGRKCDEVITWFSTELALKVKEYILSLMLEEEEEFRVELADINQEIGEGYKVGFNAQLMNHHKPMLNGKPVKILKQLKDTPDYGIGQRLIVELSDGNEGEVQIDSLDFKYHIID